MAIDPNNPLWLKSVEKARASVGVLRELVVDHRHDAIVKLAYSTTSGEKEHVWGRLLELSTDSMRVALETPPINHRGELPRELTVPLSDLEDWFVQMPDGQVRGGFTTQAEIRIAKECGTSIPRHLAAMESRFADIL